jgi:organic hydroperoxide reductase OsmC/OhrA
MTELRASIRWQRTTEDFSYDTYSRAPDVRVGSGVSVPGSGAAEFKGDATRVNPEELFVAALSACHMLTFLAIAARKRLVVDAYEDDARGWLEKNADGRLAMTRVELRPRVRFTGDVAADQLAKMHDKAHANCFIALSVNSDVRVIPAS